ncbi:alpha/beta fold hydrolase [Daeguia caeni]|uniref:Alpha/beta fold hydrolase n=1 Tax=Daeguia caeni TaxID=439612 RepID=A0ABV9H4A6_9HYPH
MSELLFGTAANPVPHGITAGTFETRDHIRLRYACLPARTQAKHGTVIILQGRNESIEKYFETMEDLAARGLTVFTFDWRGQGGSQRLLDDRLRGYVRHFDDYGADLDQILTQIILPDCPAPFYVLAHSAGGLIALNSISVLAAHITRMVLCAPLMGLAQQKISDSTMRRLTTFLCWIGLGRAYVAGGPKLMERPFADNPLSSDEKRFTRNAELQRNNPTLALGGPTVRWTKSALQAARRLNQPDQFSETPIPTLIIAAGADKVVSTAAIERFVARTRNVSLVVIDGARHELLQEADFYRAQALAAFDAFIPGTAAPKGTESTKADSV